MSLWPCALYLENGQLFEGKGFGAQSASGGEVVFNTGMAGYEEIFTDPSYSKQIVVMGYPHIGNTGINFEDAESRDTYLSGIVVRELSQIPSNWRSQSTLQDYLAKKKIIGITDVDTREITIALRSQGAQRGVIFPIQKRRDKEAFLKGKELLESVPKMEGLELVSQVSCKEPYSFAPESSSPRSIGKIIVYDFGVKTNILKKLQENRFDVRVVPHNMPYQEVLKENPVAVMLSNGPGDPSEVIEGTREVQNLISKIPIFAICMGHQVLARALGATTYKMKFGHHGVNHPVKDLRSGKVIISSHNHGFAVRAEDLKMDGVELSHVNLNDGTVEGFASAKLKFSSVQFHPESAPGPSDASYLFSDFVKGYLQ